MSGLLDVEFAKEKVNAVLRQITYLKTVDFPYDEPKAALDLLEALYEGDLVRLDSLDPGTDPDVRQQTCAHCNLQVAKYQTVLGFVLRATNVRNAFEIYDPLLSLCKQVYGPQAKLILSSEWSFSPFTYPAVFKDLPDLMFIGLPACEAGNALIVPLTGHELGHSLWRMPPAVSSADFTNLKQLLQNQLVTAFTGDWTNFLRIFKITYDPSELLQNLFLRNIWVQSFRFAFRQAEELFCDLLGLRLFGEGFLYSFMYVICPNLGDRAPHYPPLASRVNTLANGCSAFRIDLPADFGSYFSEPRCSYLSSEENFIVRMADVAVDALAQDLVTTVDRHIAAAGPTLPSNAERDRIAKQFKSLSPASQANSLADIINAGWQIRLNPTSWEAFGFDEATARTTLSDLVYKTVEVLEYETRVRLASC
jgi:hypothetical protein